MVVRGSWLWSPAQEYQGTTWMGGKDSQVFWLWLEQDGAAHRRGLQLGSLSNQSSLNGKTNGAGQQLFRAYGPDGCKEGIRENLFRAGHGRNGSRMGIEVPSSNGTVAFHAASVKSVQSLPRRERHYTFMKYLCQLSCSAVHHCFSHRLLLQRCFTGQRKTLDLKTIQTLPPHYQG